MNTAALKSFAPLVRRQLMEAVTQKLDFVLSAKTPDFLATFARQVTALRELAQADRVGLIERVAYTWFNRLAALRYLDARGWHPFRARVLTAAANETQPELLKLARTGALPEELRPHTNPVRLNDLLDGRIPSPNPQGEVYRHLVLAACHFYHALLPDLFERLDDETELLLPDDLLTEQSVAQGFRTEIRDEDCAQVEVLGWLYQFYISEKKDAVMGRKAAVPTADIPAVTQLFTPHWIVRYLVENSLGRLWLLNRPGSRLRDQMPYYVEGEPETDFLRIGKPEEIRVLDPAVGSGHMLTYAFDLLCGIYEEEGYAPSDVPGLILKHNLYGVDICPRAAQLASLALVLKGREKSRSFFRTDTLVRPQILLMEDVRFSKDELREYVEALDLGDLFSQPVLELLHQFEEASTLGSLIQPSIDRNGIAFIRAEIQAKDISGRLFLHDTHDKILRLLDQAEYLTKHYHIVVANPPYMTTGMNGIIVSCLVKSFYTSRSDLSASFIVAAQNLCASGGSCALVTMQSWMFLSTLDAFRKKLLQSVSILSLTHHGIGAFPSLNSKVVQTVAFVFQVIAPRPEHHPVCFRLLDYDADVKERQLLRGERRFVHLRQRDFFKITGAPIAYWISNQMLLSFEQNPIGAKFTLKEGLGTRNDPYFLRCFWEVSQNNLRSAVHPNAKWIKTDKAGGARKWFGNLLYVMNWENDGFEIKNYRNPDGTLKSRPQNTQFFFREAITWGKVGTIAKTFRYRDGTHAFNDAAPSAFGSDLAFLALSENSTEAHF